ncbi:MAG: SDR family NAD(P)-dependent oxidoreductase [Candidatus Krumholzibacteriia bacterium]
MDRFKDRYGPWAIVTGASAGIGREFATQIAAEGINLVLVARRKELLDSLGTALEKDHGVETVAVSVDLRNPEFLEPIRAATEGREIGLLVNNAGLGRVGEFLENDLDEEAGIVDVNVRAPMMLSHTYGREMVKRRRGGIMIVGSMVAFMAVPRMGNYTATKAYNLILGEVLNHELSPHGVKVSTLLPGFTAPGFTDNLDLSRVPMPIAKTPVVVRKAMRAMGRKTLVIPGVMNKMMYAMVPKMPRAMNTAMMGMMMKRVRWKN